MREKMTVIELDQQQNTEEADDYREEFPSLGAFVSTSCRNFFTRKHLFKRFPVLEWIPKYKTGYLLADFVAGLTVGLTVIPQGIAYAVIANLEPQYGLYSSFMGCFMYFLFGSCKDVTIGPTAIMALMVQVHVASCGPQFAILLAFLSGCIILLLGILNLGFLIQFISMPVTVGFTSAAAITIASGQVKSLLGISGSSNEFLQSWINIFQNIHTTRLWDSLLGISSIIILLLMMQLKDIRGRWHMYFKYLSLSRNALIVIGGTGLAYYFSTIGETPFLLTGKVGSGLPPFQLPPFSAVVRNETLGFMGMVNELGSSIFAVPLVAIMESIAIAKAFSKGKTIDATQEMIALGICNIMGSFVSSMPTTGSFTRTAVNNNSGVRTTLGGIITGSLVLLALGLLTSTFYFIPKATLAAVIITAMFFMVEFHAMAEIWRTKRIDIIPLIVTLISCLWLGLEFGILIGTGVNLCFVLYVTSRPHVDLKLMKIGNIHILMIIPDQSIVFSSAEYLKTKIIKSAIQNYSEIVIIDGEFIQSIDSTAVKNLAITVNDLKLQNKSVIFWNWKRNTQNTAFRFNRELFAPLFKSNESLDDLVLQWKVEYEHVVIP